MHHWQEFNVDGIFSYSDNLKIAHAIRAGNTVYISGQVALDPDGNVVGEGDVEAQGDLHLGEHQVRCWMRQGRRWTT